MKDELNELEQNKTQEELDAAAGKVSLEENDNWTFDAEAPMLNADFDSENFVSEAKEEVKEPLSVVREPAPKPIPLPVQKPSKNEKPVTSDVKTRGSDKVMFVLIALITALVITALAFLGYRYYTVPNSDEKMNPGNVAVTIDGTDVSVGMYNFYYSNVVNEFTSGYADGIDPYSDFSKQKTTDDDGNTITWMEKFEEITIDDIRNNTAMYNMGVEAGITLTKEHKTQIDDTIKALKDQASQEDKTIDTYLSDNYGKNCGVATIRKYMEQSIIASEYEKTETVNLKLTDEEYEAYEKKHAEEYKYTNICYLPMVIDPEKKDDAKNKLAQGKKYASQIKSKDDMKLLIPKACKEMIEQYVEAGYFKNKDEAAVEIANTMEMPINETMEGLPEEIAAWVFDENTKIGDATAVADEEGGAVFILLKTSDNELNSEPVYSVRHILITPESEEQTEQEAAQQAQPTYTDEQWAAAKKKANDVLAEYKKGDKTEYSFALLAEKYSKDPGSVSSGGQSFGGVYSGVKSGSMVKEFESWSMDKARKYGDTAIVKTKFGYHIMFFIENVPSYHFEMYQAALEEKKLEITEGATVKKNKCGMKNTTKAEPLEKVAEPESAKSYSDGAEVDYSELEDAAIDTDEVETDE